MSDALTLSNKICSTMRSEESMINFVNVCKRFHDRIGCEESDCEVAYLIDSTLGFLMEDHCLDEKEDFFCGMSKAFFVVVVFLGKKGPKNGWKLLRFVAFS